MRWIRHLIRIFSKWSSGHVQLEEWGGPETQLRDDILAHFCWECLNIPQEVLEIFGGERDIWNMVLSMLPGEYYITDIV